MDAQCREFGYLFPTQYEQTIDTSCEIFGFIQEKCLLFIQYEYASSQINCMHKMFDEGSRQWGPIESCINWFYDLATWTIMRHEQRFLDDERFHYLIDQLDKYHGFTNECNSYCHPSWNCSENYNLTYCRLDLCTEYCSAFQPNTCKVSWTQTDGLVRDSTCLDFFTEMERQQADSYIKFDGLQASCDQLRVAEGECLFSLEYNYSQDYFKCNLIPYESHINRYGEVQDCSFKFWDKNSFYEMIQDSKLNDTQNYDEIVEFFEHYHSQ